MRTEWPVLSWGALSCGRRGRPGCGPFEGRVESPRQTSRRQGHPEGAQGDQSRELAGSPGEAGGLGRRRVSVAGPTGGRAWGLRTGQSAQLQPMKRSQRAHLGNPVSGAEPAGPIWVSPPHPGPLPFLIQVRMASQAPSSPCPPGASGHSPNHSTRKLSLGENHSHPHFPNGETKGHGSNGEVGLTPRPPDGWAGLRLLHQLHGHQRPRHRMGLEPTSQQEQQGPRCSSCPVLALLYSPVKWVHRWFQISTNLPEVPEQGAAC